MPLKIVHCADVHIDAQFQYLPKKDAAKRYDEVHSSFLNMIEFCKEKAIDALLITGDLFDVPSPTDAECEFVKNALSSLYPINVYIIAGNHDYMNPTSPYSKQDYFSENVHIFPCFEHSFELPEKNTVIWGKSYSSPLMTPSFIGQNFDENKINILCLHGDLAGGSDYNVISADLLSSISCNYAAFGHIHHGEIFETGSVKCAYSGPPEGLYPGDDGFTGFIYGEITENETKLSQISLSLRRSLNITLDVTGMKTPQIIENALPIINNNDLFKLTLTGEYKSTDDINLPVIKTELAKHTFYIDIYDHTSASYDFDEIESEESLRGAFLRELRKISQSEEEFILCAKAGLDALAGKIPSLGGEIC